MEELIQINRDENGRVVVSSRQIAKDFGKEHRDVTATIKTLVEGCAEKSADLFCETKYQNEQNKQWYKEYLLTRDGFSLLVMGFTGAEALKWKLKYIDAFNKMEQSLINLNRDSYMIEDPVARAERWIEEQKEKQQLKLKIEEQKPKVEFAEQVLQSTDTIDMKAMAKLVSKNGIKIGRNKLFEFLRMKDILDKNNEPYQEYMDREWFHLVENTFNTGFTVKITKTTYVTPKGQIGIIRMLKKYFKK